MEATLVYCDTTLVSVIVDGKITSSLNILGTLQLEVSQHIVTAFIKCTSVPLSTRNTFSVAYDARHTCTGRVCPGISLGTNIGSAQVTVRNHSATAVDARARKVSVSRNKEVSDIMIVRQAELPVHQLVQRGTTI